MAEPKKYQRVSEVPSRTRLVRTPKGLTPRDVWHLNTPDGQRLTFYSADDAQRYIYQHYPNRFLQEGSYDGLGQNQLSSRNTTNQSLQKLEAPARQPHYLSEDLPVYIPSQGSTPFERMMNVKIANNRLRNIAQRRALDNLGMNPLNWPEKGGLLAGGRNESYWDSDIHQAVVEGNNMAAALPVIATAPAWAPEILPVALRGLGQGLKWRYTTPSGWILGAAAELPLVAYAADQQAAENLEDNRNRLERLWDYAWDNPGKTFMTLAGLLAGYNWANNRWGTTPKWKYEGTTPKAGDIIPYDSNYARLAKSLPRRVLPATKSFFKNNWLAIPAAGYGLLEFGDWLFSNPDSKPDSKQKNATDTNTSNTPSLDSLPAGFTPIQGVNEAGQIVVSSNSGNPDSIITLQDVPDISRFKRK